MARIAVANLTPAARTRIARILRVADTPEAVANGLAQASLWADETKAATNTGNWHFINLTIQDKKSDIPERCKNDDCAPARIRIFASELKSRVPDPRWSQLDALRYVVHFVGDIHQPMHDISDADLGGNCELIDPPLGNVRNLHAVWDGGIISAMGMNDRELADSLDTAVQGMSEHERQRVSEGNQNDWVWEGHELAIEQIYRKLHVPVEPVIFPASCREAPSEIAQFKLSLGSVYIDEMKPIVRTQLTKAGLRLARLLNESL